MRQLLSVLLFLVSGKNNWNILGSALNAVLMLFADYSNYLNKENSDSVKEFSGSVLTLRTKYGRDKN